jgi:hypothetical protein
LDEQFAAVKKLTDMSEVMQWGDLTFLTEPIGNFLGKGVAEESTLDMFLNTFKTKLRKEKHYKKHMG